MGEWVLLVTISCAIGFTDAKCDSVYEFDMPTRDHCREAASSRFPLYSGNVLKEARCRQRSSVQFTLVVSAYFEDTGELWHTDKFPFVSQQGCSTAGREWFFHGPPGRNRDYDCLEKPLPPRGSPLDSPEEEGEERGR